MRQAGVLIPLFSIRTPSGWGLGEIPDLVPFARWASSAGFSVIQVLPVHEASRGQTSPYGALSAFALDPVYVAVEALDDFQAAGGLDALSDADRTELEAVRTAPAVAWERARGVKSRALRLAFAAFHEREWKPRTSRAAELETFARGEASWLDDYTLFVALHDERQKSWTDWEAPLRSREPGALADARARLSGELLFQAWLQWQLDRQWHAARREANAAGVELMGDLPFMVSTDSADVWSRPFDFRLDASVGVPPDAFSETGQDWGLPVYRWDVMDKGGFAWMNERARRSAQLYGLYRVDHVVGLYRTYYRALDGGPAAFVPSEEAAQIRNGEKMMQIFSRRARVIAEDLGTVPDFVRASLTRCGVPGYRILRWEREWKVKGMPFRDPARWPALSVGTTGTHDTDSLADWYDSAPADERQALLEMPGLGRLRDAAPPRFDDRVRDALLDAVYRSGSDLLLLPLQDALGTRERVNTPGTVTDANWTYRMAQNVSALAADSAAVERLRSLARKSGRIHR